MLVVDASALAYALLGTGAGSTQFRRRLVDEECHAPHLLDAEIGNVLRRRVVRRELPAEEAEQLLDAAAALVDLRYPMTGRLARSAWSYHPNLSFYDALYVALASALRAPLVTADRQLAQAPGLDCRVEVVAPG